MLPHFIIIGAMKGGTTSLYHHIASHPDIEPSSVKETDFFKTTDSFSQGISWYESLWNKDGTHAFEASPNYTKRHIFPGVPKRMHSLLPNIKLIYVVRDPIERIVSHYIHNYAHGRESRSFSEAVKGKHNNYIQTSRYYYQLQAYLEYYSEDNLLIIESEKLHNEPANVLIDVFSFLGLPTIYDHTIVTTRFHSSNEKRRKSLAEQWASNKTQNRILLRMIQEAGKHFRQPIERPIVSSDERRMLFAEIGPDVEALRRFSGKTFSGWSL